MLRMEWRHGINTPVHVPCFSGSFLLCCWCAAAENKKDGAAAGGGAAEEEFVELEASFLAGDDKK